ncbi:MAG: diacylglycerol/lipid kinase family protein [Pirellulaceae bacterium]
MTSPSDNSIPVQQRRAIIIAVNPNAGSSSTRRAADQLADELVARDFQVGIESDMDVIHEMAHTRPDLRTVVAAGGDGTIALLANRLPRSTTFSILPQGTENLLAKHLRMPFDPPGVARVIDEGISACLDTGRANGQLFLVMASCGFDAEVVHQVHKIRKGNIRHWAYAKPIINSIRKYRYPTLSIYCDDESKPIRAKWAFVFNAPRYAMGLPIADQASALDGQLDLCAFRGGNLANGLLYLAGIIMRRHRRWKDTNVARVTRIRIEAEEEVPYQLDGDPGGHLPLELEVVPQRLNIFVPQVWARKNGIEQTAHQVPEATQ